MPMQPNDPLATKVGTSLAHSHKFYTWDLTTKVYFCMRIPANCELLALHGATVALTGWQIDDIPAEGSDVPAVEGTDAEDVDADYAAAVGANTSLPAREVTPGQVLRIKSATNIGTLTLILFGKDLPAIGDLETEDEAVAEN